MQYSITSIATLAALASLAQAHFSIVVPGSRGDNHDTQTTGPCGGAAAVSDANRVLFNPNGTPIDIISSHSQAVSYVKFCAGDASDCMSQADFNVTLVDPFLEIGAGDFCIPAVKIPSSIPKGTKGTIQFVMVATDGNLYNCIDVEISDKGITESDKCTNSSGVSANVLSRSGSVVIIPTSPAQSSAAHVHGSSNSTSMIMSASSTKSGASASASATAGAASFGYRQGLGAVAAAVGIAACLL
ncbi:hypothetical protein NADFUDRAFT_46743 [Nadsonia fulvescens var. elongata DSM 6958]|uniref:Copper acquisition factor BIM1-like domain-containing protein n=1 Tax=Nadsonia fulvescens var. elongata DSM 6958 TaxID=857566 RepID=A0A1E3PHN5_9ASCO|nr:hypothetical protein NADFUDRAFT_46743 [Nadsonia fulvescens var. elongata DSM 6958]